MTNATGISQDESLVICEAIQRFCAETGRACYGAFSPEVLRDYVTFHIQHNTLAWVREGASAPGAWSITGVAVAWQCDPEAVFPAILTNRTVFNWQPTDPQGRAIFIADVVATTPHALAALLQTFATRFPKWREKPIYTFRHGRIVYVTPRTLVRLWKTKIQTKQGGH